MPFSFIYEGRPLTKIIDLPTTASTDANTFVPVYKNGKTQKVSATVFGGGGSGSLSADFTSLYPSVPESIWKKSVLQMP